MPNLREKKLDFSRKIVKKGPKTGSVGITLQKMISQFFHHFLEFLKVQAADKPAKYVTDGHTDTSRLKSSVAEQEAPSAQLMVKTVTKSFLKIQFKG